MAGAGSRATADRPRPQARRRGLIAARLVTALVAAVAVLVTLAVWVAIGRAR